MSVRHFAIPGWCVGADVQNGLTKVGYMFFLRDDFEAGALKSLRIKQQDVIVLPFLEDNCISMGWTKGTGISDWLFACLPMDAEMNGIRRCT